MRGGFLDFLDSMMIATEADDITTQVADDTRAAMGGGSMTTQDDPRNEDLENTDDIFGQNATPGDPNGNPDPDQQEAENGNETEDNPENTEDVFNQGEEGQENPEDPNLTEDQQQNNETKSPDDEFLFAKKNDIRDNLAHLYSILNGDIETLTSSLNNLNDMASLKVTNEVLNLFRNSKTNIYNTLTKDIENLEYDELLRRYITLKRVYDIGIRMLEEHFKESGKKKK